MKIESQVCTLEQAKKLYKLGLNLYLASLFCWECNKKQNLVVQTRYIPVQVGNNKYFSAFTASELIKMNDGCTTEIIKSKLTSEYFIEKNNSRVYFAHFASAIAERIILDIENGLLNAETCNKRLLED